jgi:hypothetical protein
MSRNQALLGLALLAVAIWYFFVRSKTTNASGTSTAAGSTVLSSIQSQTGGTAPAPVIPATSGTSPAVIGHPLSDVARPVTSRYKAFY